MFATKDNALNEEAFTVVLEHTGMPKAREHSESLFEQLSTNRKTVDIGKSGFFLKLLLYTTNVFLIAFLRTATLLKYLETLQQSSIGLPLMSSAPPLPLKTKQH